MSQPATTLVPVDATPDAHTDVVGTAHMVAGELVVRMRPAYRDATTRPIPWEPDPEPTTLSHLGFMRYVGPGSPEDAAEVRRMVAFCEQHPVLAWLRGWTR